MGHGGQTGKSQGRQTSVSTVDLRGTSYITDVTVGTQSVPLLVDTGSADLWVAPSSFICLDAGGNKVPQPGCGFPVFFEGNFSGGEIPGQYFSVYYGSGQFAYGPYGFETVSLGGITVPDQQIALPSKGFIRSSTGDYSGIIGLGYPGMVAARNGTVPQLASNTTNAFVSYDTWFFNAIKNNLTHPLFSLALNIDGGGLLGIGGVVDVPIVGGYASTPILMIDLVGEARAETQFTFYTIAADDYIINGQSFSNLSMNTNTSSSSRFPVIIDSGYSANVLPPSLVDLFYSALSTAPQVVEIDGSNMFATACDTEMPSLGVQIGNQVFEMHSQDTLVANLNTMVNGTAFCGLGIQPGVEGAGALGDPFLSNVVAVFDIGASEMRFAQRATGAFEDSPPKDSGKGPSCPTGRPRKLED
ncbi:hypothetical protein VP1G_03620 [Cytospora mali]|uniref:Peptidase A1 domain-containing protein n=1 Tax=Cytospora mali TaxID=578113 RepID=A0A194UX28_CYTMA|nr:hypothetical protein VP1G_03620 [Valsa mali var. pyri (nom. inval.)]